MMAKVSPSGPKIYPHLWLDTKLKSDKLGHLMNPPTEKLVRKRSKPAELKPLTGFAWVDARYLYPFFTRRITREELSQNRHQMRQLTSKWYQEVREHHHESDYTNEL